MTAPVLTDPALMTGDELVDYVRTAAWNLTHRPEGAEEERAHVRAVLGPLRVPALQALVLLLAYCADPAKVSKVCAGAHRAALMREAHLAETAERHGEYAHLRDNGVSAELAGPRVEIRSRQMIERYEAQYQAEKQQREGRSVAA